MRQLFFSGCMAAGLLIVCGVCPQAEASYEVRPRVLTDAGSAQAVRSGDTIMTLSVRQRGVVGPAQRYRRTSLASGYQAMISGLGLVPEESLLSTSEKRRAVRNAISRFRASYGYAGALDYDAAKALIQQRAALRQALIDELARLGPGGAELLRSVYPEMASVREKLLLVESLGQMNDPAAAGVLSNLLQGNEEFSVSREIVAALGHRSEPAAEQILSGLLGSADYRMGMAAAQGLSGRAGATPVLAETVLSEERPDQVRREAIRSLGLVGDEAAKASLLAVAMSETDLRTRQTAIQELGRSYGEEALDTLGPVLDDPNERIRINVVRAVGRVQSTRSTEILRRVAAEDASQRVREHAAAYLEQLATSEEGQP